MKGLTSNPKCRNNAKKLTQILKNKHYLFENEQQVGELSFKFGSLRGKLLLKLAMRNTPLHEVVFGNRLFPSKTARAFG